MEPVERLTALLARLDLQTERLRTLHRYYDGRSAEPFIPKRAGADLRKLAEISRTAWGGLLVDSVVERLVVDGVKATDPRFDDVAWGWWQANGLDARQCETYADALICSETLVLVWPGLGGPTIRGLDRRDAIGRTLGHDPWRLAEAAYRWRSDDDSPAWMAALYDEEAAWLFAQPVNRQDPVMVTRWWRPVPDQVQVPPMAGWAPVDVMPHELGQCPVVRVANVPDLRGRGRSDLAPHMALIDRITDTVMGRLTAGRFGAYRQRWASGQPLGAEIDPQTGEPVLGPDGKPRPAGAPYQYGADLVWVSEDPNTKFGDFAATDLRPIIEAVDQDVKQLAAVSRTPAHYLLGGTANPPSAEALLAAESGLTSKVERRQLAFGEAWEQVIRLAATAAGEPGLAEDSGLQVVWRNTEVRSPGAVADALLKLRQVGIPLAVLLERMGYSPQSITRITQEAAAEQQAKAATTAALFGG